MTAQMKRNMLLMPIDCRKSDVTLVDDNLFVGNKELAHNRYSLEKLGISLVIGVYPKDSIALAMISMPTDCRFHHIDANDHPYEDLISRFDFTIDLMTEEITERDGKVVVFCGSGYSRSVTIVSAFLMKKYAISGEEAVARVRTARKRINPNPGFVAQLALYWDMNYRLDETHPEYRVFALICLKGEIWCDKYWANTKVGALERQFSDPMRKYLKKLNKDNDNCRLQKPANSHYHCCHCNHVVFDELNVLKSERVDSRRAYGSDVCDKIFIEPMKWMLPLICCNQEGDLKCPNCETILGSFQWKAFNCECILHNQLKGSIVFKIERSLVK